MIATDVNAEKLEELRREQPSVVTDILDVTKKVDVERLLKEKYNNVNVLFNCAGYARLRKHPFVSFLIS